MSRKREPESLFGCSLSDGFQQEVLIHVTEVRRVSLTFFPMLLVKKQQKMDCIGRFNTLSAFRIGFATGKSLIRIRMALVLDRSAEGRGVVPKKS